MKYVVRRVMSPVQEGKEISEENFLALMGARRCLFEMLAIEEKYDLLIRNYLEFERVVYNSSIAGVVYLEHEWSDFMEHVQSLNLVLMNFLAMSRSYVDQVPQHLRKIFSKDSSQVDKFHAERREAHSRYLGYRALYYIRNHVQHCGLPVHAFSRGSDWLADADACRHLAIPYVSIAELRKNSGFNKKVLRELSDIGEKVDLRQLVRENMSAFGMIHKFVRSLAKEDVGQAESLISSTIKDFSISEENLPFLYVESLGQSGDVEERSIFFGDALKRRKFLEKKNRTLLNVEKHFVTGQLQSS